jgi:hypothetical protein
MTAATVQSAPVCGRCRQVVPSDLCNLPALAACPNCGTQLRVVTFPSLNRTQSSGALPEELMADGEAGCFFHPQKKAVVPCANCGRFLCALCDLELNGQHLCPGCLESGKQKGRIEQLDNHRTLHASVALSLVVIPTMIPLLWFVTFLTAPAALFVVIRYWKAPPSLVRRRPKLGFIIAAVLASLQLLAWVVWIVWLVTEGMN